jgi:hypothetical protein
MSAIRMGDVENPLDVTARSRTLPQRINSLACGANINKSLAQIVGYRGDASFEVMALNRDAQPRCLGQWRILDSFSGAWIDISAGERGPDLISLVERLGN